MRDEPFDLPIRLAGSVAMLVLTALRVTLTVVLSLLRPFVVLPLLLGIVGGLGAGLVFGFGHHWEDAARAVFVSIACSVALMVYAGAASWVDPEHFTARPIPAWRQYL